MAATATTDRPVLTAAPISAPLANLCLTFALTIVTLTVAGSLGGTKGYEMLIVGMGWPHVILGFLFYFGKVLNDEVQARSYFIMLALLTVILWSAHYSFTITGVISIYFTYHVFRDEVFMYFQMRARHKLAGAVRIGGLLPFILLMFFVTDPRPQYYRQDLRSGEIDSGRVNSNGWSFISFEPISYSGGKDFYFFVEARGSKGTQGLGLNTTGKDVQPDGEIRVADRKWAANGDLVFQAYYSDSPNSAPSPITNLNDQNHIRVSGDYRLGQTFRASRDNLAGMWISTATFADAPYPNNLKFHVTPDTSAPLPALSPTLKVLRWLVIVILAALVLWKALPHLQRDGAFWLYFFFFVGVLAVIQKVLKVGDSGGSEMPVMFQVIVVFHYWSWYVFSFSKLRALPSAPFHNVGVSRYDKFLLSLRSVSRFSLFVVALNVVSFTLVFWYSTLRGPATLRYLVDYSYFLYFLVFHVTFSFAPKRVGRAGSAKTKTSSVPVTA